MLYTLGVARTSRMCVFPVTDRFDTVSYDLATTRVWVIDALGDNAEFEQAMRLFLSKYAFVGVGARSDDFWV